jgi:hypothetical protein
MSAALVSFAGGTHRDEYTFAPGLCSGGGTSRGGCNVISRSGSAVRAAVSRSAAAVPVAGTAVPLSAEFCHLKGEVLDMLYRRVAVGKWDNARELRLGGDLVMRPA